MSGFEDNASNSQGSTKPVTPTHCNSSTGNLVMSEKENRCVAEQKAEVESLDVMHLRGYGTLRKVKSKLIALGRLQQPWGEPGKAILQFLMEIVIKNQRKAIVSSIAEIMVAKDFFSVCVRIWDFYCVSEAENETAVNNSDVYFTMKRILWNYTDNSLPLAKAAYENKAMVERCVRELSFSWLDVNSLSENRKNFFIKATLGMLYNIVRLYSPNKLLVTQNNGVHKVLKYFCSSNAAIKAGATMLLAFCIQEDDNDKIVADNQVVDFMIEALSSTLDSSEHVSEAYGFTAKEIVICLDKLASNDKNKKSLVEAGVLPLLTKILQTSNTDESELSATVHFLWTLSFHPESRENIRSEEGLLEAMDALLEQSPPDSYIARSCNGINFVVNGTQAERALFGLGQDDGSIDAAPVHKGHIMISYQWDVQPTILHIRDKLKESGYNLWIDVDDMEGDILSAMANAVENSDLVIIAVTENYKNSNACRTEATYAYKLGKPILPLLLQHNYKPDGWLGALLGMKLYLDISQEGSLDKKYDKLLEMIDMKNSNIPNEKEVTASMTETSSLPSPESNKSRENSRLTKVEVSSWNVQQVAQWVRKTEIDGLPEALSKFDGIDLSQLKNLLERSPDTYYAVLRKDFELSWNQIFHLTDVLETLDKD
ncbi:uncharacterized protein LOC143445919 isoform X1 [Clavelina lepadiformis]|uniref:uncharacterized protein LOC143445919 isoform X1 n=2 Tax=Clavelina lepadiformis TaxID=159417 RepID=UPI0040431844